MCEKHVVESDRERNSSENDGMTKVVLERKVREHMERRKSAYVKMGTVDEPRE